MRVDLTLEQLEEIRFTWLGYLKKPNKKQKPRGIKNKSTEKME